MQPYLCGVPTYHVLWLFAIVAWVTGGARLATAAGFPKRASVVLLLVGVLSTLAGAKVQHLLENPEHMQDSLVAILTGGERLPGGLVASTIVVPVAAHALGLPLLRFVDAVVPMAGVSLALGRLGCLLNGCCFGTLCYRPWAIQFPAGSRVHETHRLLGLVSEGVPSLPVHPLQL